MAENLSTTVTALLAGAVTAILLYLAFLWVRNPVLMKIGLRNLVRRPMQSALIVIGLTLSTIIVISSLGIGDTLRLSIQRQAIAAYGEVDEIIAPPLLSLFANAVNPDIDPTQAQQAQETMERLTAGGLESVLALVQGGLPSISEEQLAQLRRAAAEEPLIDGVAGSIVFPTIVRNIHTGQGEPLGFIFAVDDSYTTDFGLSDVDGRPLTMESLQPGVGSIFQQVGNTLNVIPALAEQFGELQTSTPLSTTLEDFDARLILMSLGTLLTGIDPATLPDLGISLGTLEALGVDTTPLRQLGREQLTLREIAALLQRISAAEVNIGETVTSATVTSTAITSTAITSTTALSIPLTGILSDTQGLTENAALLQFDPSQMDITAALGASLNDLGDDLLRAINLNTLGYQLDAVLGRFGLQLRQGEIYLNRLGAERLHARAGDLIELYIGPLPVRYRVRAIVDQAGPLSALAPVIMLRLDEAQQLLFMPEKVNSVLISNLGDAVTGMQYTAAVSERLRVLALDEESVSTIAATLARPDVRAFLTRLSADLPDTRALQLENADEDVPPIIANLLEGMSSFLNIQQIFRQDVEALLAASSAGTDNTALRELLASPTVREWLLHLELPVDIRSDFAAAVANLNQFEQIEVLNKTTIISIANVGGGVFASIFSALGSVSILAAMLLIVLIFVMLAAERRVEIGVARAIGLQRSQIVQSFMAEGMVYNLTAAALGVLLGLVLTLAMTQFIGRIFNEVTGVVNSQVGGIFAIRFAISWHSIVTAYCLGVLITWLAMVISSWRVTRMNIAAALRGLPDETEEKRRSRFNILWSWLWPLSTLSVGGWLLYVVFATPAAARVPLYWALLNRSFSLIMIAVTLLLYGFAVLVGRLLELTPLRSEIGYRIVYTLLGVGLLIIWIPPWYTLAPQWFNGRFIWDPTQGPAVFTIGGPLIIVGCILIVMFNANLLGKVISAILGFAPSLRPVLRTAIAYPLSHRFRTGMTMLLFAMVLATVVVMAIIIHTMDSMMRLDEKQTAGFEIIVSPTLLSFFNPLESFPEALAALSDSSLLDKIEAVGLVTEQSMEGKVAEGAEDFRPTSMAGVNAGYIESARQIYRLRSRAAGYADDDAVWAALAERDDVVIALPRLFEQESVQPFDMIATASDDSSEAAGVELSSDFEDRSWERRRRFLPPLRVAANLADRSLPKLFLTLTTDGADGVRRTHTVQVIGVLEEEANLVTSTLIGSEATLAHLRSVPVKGDYIYVNVKDGEDVHKVAAEIEQTFISSALDAVVLEDQYVQQQQILREVLQLFQSFMALGLLVGIAALGVISTRSVYERRQQIGMLRALGYQRNMVGLNFLIEASFISITGLTIGIIAGVVMGNNLLSAFLLQVLEINIRTPWPQIVLIAFSAYLFSLLTTIAPAWQASRIYPAEALRYE